MASESRVKSNNIYSHMEFPDYEYREYPKMVTAGGESAIVQNLDEETAWLAAHTVLEEPAAAAVATVAAELGKVSAGGGVPPAVAVARKG